MRAEKDVNEGHGDARLACSGSHNEERPALVGGEYLCETANGLVLVGTVNDGTIDRDRFERSAALAQELHPLQVWWRKKNPLQGAD